MHLPLPLALPLLMWRPPPAAMPCGYARHLMLLYLLSLQNKEVILIIKCVFLPVIKHLLLQLPCLVVKLGI